VYFLLVYVITAPEGDRIYDKKHTCFFCHKEYSKIARHLEQVHGEEEEVKTALKYDPNDPKRVEQFEKLCRMGNFNHNMKVLDINEGELKVVRRPPANAKVNPKDYLPCKFCHGFFLDNELWRHAPKCKFRNEETESSSKRMKYDGKFMLAAGQLTTPALNNLSLKKHNKPDVLPLTDDLFAVRNYVVGRIAVLTEKVRKSATRDNWRELAEVTLSSVLSRFLPYR
jgi:hypothetical protein